ncbi:hypothetical protein GGI12_006029, partial [Dipsacomyces acuminosporus]
RFDLDKVGFQQLFRRASESNIIHQSHHAKHVQESLERKLSLPLIPDMGKLRSSRQLRHSSLALSALNQQQQQQQQQQPSRKRLKTILEDSTGTTLTPDDGLSDMLGLDNDSDEYLIANIALYLVSNKLSIMVCHYEDTFSPSLPDTQQQQQQEDSIGTLASGSSLTPSLSPTVQCDCMSNASTLADAERVQNLLSQIHKLDIIDTPRAFSTQIPDRGDVLGSAGNSLASRHSQIYSIDSERLLCAFPEEGYTKIFGQSPLEATRKGANLRSLWKAGSEGRIEGNVLGLLQHP